MLEDETGLRRLPSPNVQGASPPIAYFLCESFCKSGDPQRQRPSYNLILAAATLVHASHELASKSSILVPRSHSSSAAGQSWFVSGSLRYNSTCPISCFSIWGGGPVPPVEWSVLPVGGQCFVGDASGNRHADISCQHFWLPAVINMAAQLVFGVLLSLRVADGISNCGAAE